MSKKSFAISPASVERFVKRQWSNQPQPKTQFQSLNDDCILEILNWLSINDLHSMNLTCKRLNKLSNEQFHRNYGRKLGWSTEHLRYKHFYSNTQHLRIRGLHYMSRLNQKVKQNVKKITFRESRNITEAHSLQIIRFLTNVEMMVIYGSTFHNNMYHDLLQHCTNIKCLAVTNDICEWKPSDNFENVWLTKEYPTLEQVFLDFDDFPLELTEFFHKNPNIKTLACVRKDRSVEVTNWLLHFGLRFENLVLTIRHTLDEDIPQLVANINSLHRNKQFNKLHLCIPRYWISIVCDLCAYLESIHIIGTDKVALNIIAKLKHLKCIRFENSISCTEKMTLNMVATELIELEELHFEEDFIDIIIPFVRHSPKLKRIYMHCTLYDNNRMLKMLNNERMKLKNACPLTIYMDEDDFLQMKWASSTDRCQLIQIKRIESHISTHPLANFVYAL